MSEISYTPNVSFTPREIVSELDKHVIGQGEAKKAVAIALRNRWRRLQVPDTMREEVMPKNILMIGPTGVGKTEIARRLAKLYRAPFIKVEATKYTEIGYVGRDVEQIIRDLAEIAYIKVKQDSKTLYRAQAKVIAREKIITLLVGANATEETKEKYRTQLSRGLLDTREIEIEVNDSNNVNIDLNSLQGGQQGMVNMADLLGKSLGINKTKRKTVKIEEALEIFLQEASETMLDQDKLVAAVKDLVEQNGIVFIDEIDKICSTNERRGGDVSREGVQRDLLPLIEGTTVNTKYGFIKTDHILFIASGAFHLAKPSDLLPELQGRLPIQVELKPLKEEDFVRILQEPEVSLLNQYQALLGVEKVVITFTDDAIRAMAQSADELNKSMDNIGARRLHTVVEKVMEEISFLADELCLQTITIDAKYVSEKIDCLKSSYNVAKYIL